MAVELQQILFYVFAFIAVCAALMVVTMNNPVRAVLALVLVFFATAGLWILAQVEFLALILVLVYVGAVMTLFLFMVMMLNVDHDSMKKRFIYYAPLGLVVMAVIVGLVWMVKPAQLIFAQKAPVSETLSNAKVLGMVLYTEYAYAFEIAAVLLLVAIIAAIALANRGLVRGKRQDILKQIMTRKEDRLRVVKMAVETREPGK
jgi:NADH-quinone oxidoreductase subunit J